MKTIGSWLRTRTSQSNDSASRNETNGNFIDANLERLHSVSTIATYRSACFAKLFYRCTNFILYGLYAKYVISLSGPIDLELPLVIM